VKVKICGITRSADARAAADLGASYVGFIFVKRSPRYIEPLRAAEIIDDLPDGVVPVGVFVDETRDRVLDTISTAGLQMAQLHGDETPRFCASFGSFPIIKAFRVRPPFGPEDVHPYRVGTYLLDTYHPTQAGGTGETFDWSLAALIASHARVMLAGGLTPHNVVAAVEAVHPSAVDASSGVESAPGIKNHALLEAFFGALDAAGYPARRKTR
jgi:phosphoribosylanthranilate isomerase